MARVSDAELHRLAAELGEKLHARGWMLATAESCTGGWVGQLLTSLPGSSQWYERGFITYANAAKIEMLGVPAGTIGTWGAVSEETAGAMAAGALARRLEFAALPTLPVVQDYLHEAVARDCVLAGGDDYELCFTAPADRRDAVAAAAQSVGVAVTRIGRITAGPGLTVIGPDGRPLPFEHTGYDHFAA
ncbi:MAG: nicotinamide-nucleotide amidohydrolase family protein [Candidatus Thermoplasmatota archaeon]|nr:nicotinamide-nucleotide amidohydrolase family protein [Candidatus Thermoplasmatota archaeon]